VIDLSGLKERSPAAIERIAKKIGIACRDVGFFYVRNHGIPQDLMDKVFAASKSFFSLPEAVNGELSTAKSKHSRGYVGMSSERLDIASKPNTKTLIDRVNEILAANAIGYDRMAENVRVIRGNPVTVRYRKHTPGDVEAQKFLPTNLKAR
jgi:isopenicillin N synthase-like dioxygenase